MTDTSSPAASGADSLPVADIRRELQAGRRDMNDAEHLQHSGRSRAAINRSYYAVYHATLAAFLIVAPGLDQHHGNVKSQFHFIDNDERFPATPEDREFVAQLQTARNTADYEPDQPLPLTADESVDGARDLVDRLAEGCNQTLDANGHAPV